MQLSNKDDGDHGYGKLGAAEPELRVLSNQQREDDYGRGPLRRQPELCP